MKNVTSVFIRQNKSNYGWDGLTTFILSNLFLIFSLGIFFIFLCLLVLVISVKAKTSPTKNKDKNAKIILVAGLRLEENKPKQEYKVRLNRANNLYQTINNSDAYIVLLGGYTGSSSISEARAGANYLIDSGLNKSHILLEEASKHTLENLQEMRTLLSEKSLIENNDYSNVYIVSSRYHLCRLLILTKGLKISLTPIAAEEFFKCNFTFCFKLLIEAYYLHWYFVGKVWAKLTNNKKSIERIS
ncbi:MAG: YdcF family protein [Gammaproteobacteria bacterium]|nr:YdcF family protein [Gammaproteobacteria bacterium]